MKFTYNWLKDFVEIKIPAVELADKLTMAGLEVKAIEEKEGDFVFEIEVTSNRPDWLSVIGIAREVAVITNSKLKIKNEELQFKIQNFEEKKYPLKIRIENKKDCPLYTVKIIKNVKVGSSPDWLKKRLELVGCRSVNNVVDITNYVLFETGEPLHAFDLDKLASTEIIVRRANDGEVLISIDGENRKLTLDILVIADKFKPVAIAGVMGGKNTEVEEGTKNILLEAAIFNPVIIRRGRQKLGMNSDASYRFERGIGPLSVGAASFRAVELIKEFCGGNIIFEESSGAVSQKKINLDFPVGDIKRYLGLDIPIGELKKILCGLGFRMKRKNKNIFAVNVPSWRLDIKTEIDLVEEIARIYGYENIPSTLAPVILKSHKPEGDGEASFSRSHKPEGDGEGFQDYIGFSKDVLIGLGLNEVITCSLIERKILQGFWDKKDAVIEIANPLSLEQEVMRPVLMPSLSQRIAYNLRQQNPSIKIFEIAKTYKLESDGEASNSRSHKIEASKVKEKYSLALALCDTEPRWLGPKQGYVQDDASFLHLKGIIDLFLERLGIQSVKYRFVRPVRSPGHFNNCAAASNGVNPERNCYEPFKLDSVSNRGDSVEIEVLVKNENVGMLRKLSKEILDSLDIKHREVFCAEIYLEEKIFPLVNFQRKFNAANVPRYPGITRDITLPVKNEVTFEEISTAIYELKEPLLINLRFQDCYEGEKVSQGTKRITVSLYYGSSQRTLTEEEAAFAHAQLVQALEAKFCRGPVCYALTP